MSPEKTVSVNHKKILLQDCLNNPNRHIHDVSFRTNSINELVVDQLHFLQVKRLTFDVSSFLDNRIYCPQKSVASINYRQLQSARATASNTPGRLNFIFHTSFCCSTLLSRLLQVPGYTLSLREPKILLLLAQIQQAGHVPKRLSQQAWRQLLKTCLDLLGKRYKQSEQVLIKPSNLANTLASEIMHLREEARGIWLTNTLEEFLVSMLKKTAETQAKIPELIQRLTAQQNTLRPASLPLQNLTNLQAAAVFWQCQQEHMQQQLERFPERLLRIDANELLTDPAGTSYQANHFLGLNLPESYFMSHLFRDTLQHHAKAPQLQYAENIRQAENHQIRNHYHQELQQTLEWHANNYSDNTDVSYSAA